MTWCLRSLAYMQGTWFCAAASACFFLPPGSLSNLRRRIEFDTLWQISSQHCASASFTDRDLQHTAVAMPIGLWAGSVSDDRRVARQLQQQRIGALSLRLQRPSAHLPSTHRTPAPAKPISAWPAKPPNVTAPSTVRQHSTLSVCALRVCRGTAARTSHCLTVLS